MALIVENTFTSMYALCQHLTKKYLKIRLFENEAYFKNIKFESDKLINFIKCPIFFICGLCDQIVPPSMSSTLFKLATNAKSKDLYEISSKEHNDLYDDSYYEHLNRILNKNI